MNNNFLGIRGLYKTHMDELKPFNSKSVTYTYIGYTEHNSRGQPIVRRDTRDFVVPRCCKPFFKTIPSYLIHHSKKAHYLIINLEGYPMIRV